MVLAFIIGCFFGIISGLVPGITLFVSLIMAYPLLLSMSPMEVMVVYITIASISQFFGSVSATLFSVPGSLTSLPALYEGHALTKNNQGGEAIMYSAIGSFIGSVSAVAISLLLISNIVVIYSLFTTELRSLLLLLTLLLFVFIGRNRWYINVLMILAGMGLGLIGYDMSSNTDVLTFGNAYLYGGLPTISVVLALFILPLIVSYIKPNNKIDFIKLSLQGYKDTLKDMASKKYTLIRGVVIGYLVGFIPGLTFHVGTTLAYYTEKRLTKNYKQGNLNCLLAAETANNTGVFTQILPLLLIGIPITNSQAFIYDILLAKGMTMDVESLYNLLIAVIVAYVLSAVVGVYTAGKYVNWVSVVAGLDFNKIYYFVIILLLGVAFYAGSMYYQGWYYLLALLALLPFGLLLKKYDTMVLVFTFMLHDIFISTFKTLLQLHGTLL